MKPEVHKGAWIVAAHKALSKWPEDHVALDPFEAIITAGRAGDLFSATRAIRGVDAARFEAHRKLARLKPSVARRVLREAESLGLIEISWSTDAGTVADHFLFKENSKEAVLEAVGKVFEKLEPTTVARATLEILASTVDLPQSLLDIQSLLSRKGYPESDILLTVRLMTDLGLISQTRETHHGAPLLFNPYAFEKDVAEIHAAIKNLSPAQQQSAVEIIEFVKNNPGVPIPGKADQEILSVLVKVGLVDYSKITTEKNPKGKYFPTAPYIWGIFDKSAGTPLSQDLVDDSKLLLNSFRYGQIYSTADRGKIRDPLLIVNALLRDGAIGVVRPARAIGEDYPLALSRGIVHVVESPRYPGRFSMELLKEDVARAVYEVLEQKALLPKEHVPSSEEIDRAGQFVSPSAVRVEVDMPDSVKRYYEELVFGLRTMRKRN